MRHRVGESVWKNLGNLKYVWETIGKNWNWKSHMNKALLITMFQINFFKFLTSKLSAGGPTKMVIVVRTDLAMGKGKIGAQCAHASVQCCMQMTGKKHTEKLLRDWMRQGSPKIVVQISSEAGLYKLAQEASKQSLSYALIRDAGKTQVKAGTPTVIGIGPGLKSEVDAVTGNLKLL